MPLIILHMEHTKSTKGTHVYSAGTNSAIPSLYIKKDKLPAPPPKLLRVTVEKEV